MNLKLITVLALLVTTTFVSAQDVDATKFDKTITSYSVGYRMGLEFAGREGSELELNIEEAIKGIRDAATKKDPSIAKEDMVLNLKGYENMMKKMQYDAFMKLADDNQKRADEFLAENRKKKGIKELASGIQYREIEDGQGNNPTMDSEVVIHYRGSLIGIDDVNNYQEFDSTFVKGEPRTLKVNTALKGWQEILPLMRPGAKWQIFLPPELGFGVRGQSPIGPNEILVFDITLLEVK
ncbi:MAG: FKBP-type peptidyl-prolyl cis-trans isomerase [Marinicellaceae bacterium]